MIIMEDETKKQLEGEFYASLKRNNKQIRDDRAVAILEDSEMVYKRRVEDLANQIKKKQRKRDGMLDLSPENAMSLKLANDYNSTEFVEEDTKISLEIRNLGIKYNLAVRRYNRLFNGNYEQLNVEEL